MRHTALLALAFLVLTLSVACSSNAGNPLAQSAPEAQRMVPRVRPAGGSASQYLSHVIVIVQENRSFENFFAGYPGANAPMTGCASPLPSEPTRPHGNSTSSCPGYDTRVTLHQDTFETNPDLRHDWLSSMVDWNNSQMDGFSKWGINNGPDRAYDYIQHSQIQPYLTMANQYVLADEMFPTEFGGSFTAHLTLIAGTDDIKLPGEAEVDFPTAAPDDCDSPPGTKTSYITNDAYRQVHRFTGPFPCFDQFNTIAQVLDSAGISWKYYATKFLDGGFWEPFEAIKYVRYGSDWNPNRIVAPQTKILTDAKKGKLAKVTWVTPSKLDSDHPARKSDTGPSWVASVVNAIGKSKYWQSSAIIVLWDDWGGFYDNAAPPQLDYRGLGVRVPCLIISPYAKQNYVSHVQYEYGSILRFIEEVYDLPAGSIGPTSDGYTDARATSLDDAFDFTQAPRAFASISAKYPASHFINEPPSDEPVDTQ